MVRRGPSLEGFQHETTCSVRFEVVLGVGLQRCGSVGCQEGRGDEVMRVLVPACIEREAIKTTRIIIYALMGLGILLEILS